MLGIQKQPSRQSIYFWNIIGSMTNALLSVVILIIVSRLVSHQQSDIFSLAWSIGQLMAIIGVFQIRTYQATDVNEKFKFKQYLYFRYLTILLMLISSLLYILYYGYTHEKLIIVFLICMYKAVDSLCDVYEGWFQQKERLDLSGQSLTFRILVSLLIFTVILLLTKNLIIACASLSVSTFICFILVNVRICRKIKILNITNIDLKSFRWIKKLFIEGFPLFVNAFLMMSVMNTPKMCIDTLTNTGFFSDGVQTIYNILFMPASVISLVYIVFRPLLTKMAITWNQGNRKKFLKIIGFIELCLIAISLLILSGGYFLGVPVLSFLYSIDLSGYLSSLLVIILGGCFYTFASVLDNALVVIRKQYVLVISYIVTWVFIQLVTESLTLSFDVLGASMAYLFSTCIFFIVTLILFIICFINTRN